MQLTKSLLFIVLTLIAKISFAQITSEAQCEFDSENFSTGQVGTVPTFFLNLPVGENEFSSKDLLKVDGKDFVGRIYGAGEKNTFTLTLEIRRTDGMMLPRAAASFYRDGRKHMLAFIEGSNLLKIKCSATE